MMSFLAALVCSLLISVCQIDYVAGGSLSLRASPQPAYMNSTERLKLECKHYGVIDSGNMVIMSLLKEGRDEAVAGMSYDMDEPKVQYDRATAEAKLQEIGSGDSSYLTVTIDQPTLEDAGVYTCKFAFLDMDKLDTVTDDTSLNVTIGVEDEDEETPEPSVSTCPCDQIWEEIDRLKAEVARKSEGKVAVADDKCHSSFSARFSSMNGPIIVNEDNVIFDFVISSKGDNYDPSTGLFTAPCDGQYYFSLTLRSSTLAGGSVAGAITVDGQAMAKTFVFEASNIDNLATAANSVVLSLTQGQQVAVEVFSTSTGEFFGDEYSIFSGFYISP